MYFIKIKCHIKNLTRQNKCLGFSQAEAALAGWGWELGSGNVGRQGWLVKWAGIHS